MANITIIEALNRSLAATKKYVDDKLAEANASGGYTHPDSHPASMITGLATVATSGSYNDLTGTPDLSDYALTTDLHSHTNKTQLDSITANNITAWNKSIPFEDSYVSDCDTWLTNGYTKTNTSTAHHPSVCTGADRWGVLFYISENVANGTGTQMYFPIDGTYAGRVFTRKIMNRSAGAWNLLSTFDGNYDNLTNKPTIPTVPTNISAFTNDSGYITSIPDEYITETELTNKGYAPIDSPDFTGDVSMGRKADTTIGAQSVALGNDTTASGTSSHAEGGGTTAASDYQHVQGKYNIEDAENKYAHIVGNGASNDARSNAHTLDWNGNAWYAGKLTVGVAPTEDMDVATKQYVDDYTGGKKLRYITKAQYEELTDEQKKDTSIIYNIIDDNIETINVAANADVILKNTINDQVANIIWGESTGENIDNILVASEYYPIPYKLTNNKSVWTMYKPDDSLLSKETCYFIAYKVKCNTLTMYPDYGSNGPVLASYDAAAKNTHDATGAWIYYIMRFPANYSSYGYKGIYPTSVYETTTLLNAYAINVETEYAAKAGTDTEFLNEMITKYGGLDLVPGQDYNSTSVLTSYSVDGSVLDTATQGTDDIINIVGGGKLSISSNSASVSVAIDTDHEHTNKDVLDTITIDKINSWDSKTSFDGNYESLTNKPESLPANGGNADTIDGYSIWVGIQQDYDTIPIKSDTTIYFIKE